MIDENELRRLAEAATPGPWYSRDDELVRNNIEPVARVWWHGNSVPVARSVRNAAFIAAANPVAVLELLDTTRALRAEVERLRELVRSASAPRHCHACGHGSVAEGPHHARFCYLFSNGGTR